MRPKGFRIITLLLGLFSFRPLLSFGSYYAGPLWDAFFTGLAINIGLCLTALFWHGFNGARILIQMAYFVICAALFDFLRSDTQQPQTPLEWTTWVGQAAFGVFLFYWLNTKEVRAYFHERKTRKAAPRPNPYGDKPPIPEP